MHWIRRIYGMSVEYRGILLSLVYIFCTLLDTLLRPLCEISLLDVACYNLKISYKHGECDLYNLISLIVMEKRKIGLLEYLPFILFRVLTLFKTHSWYILRFQRHWMILVLFGNEWLKVFSRKHEIKSISDR